LHFGTALPGTGPGRGDFPNAAFGICPEATAKQEQKPQCGKDGGWPPEGQGSWLRDRV
jgi:hypothetical protein